ncbi:hypothetical protein GGS20DRAFT_569853 [Poronia punctata]|nr:hypothetical protein GGS20DRAFT_569853 [Poronia punctata]
MSATPDTSSPTKKAPHTPDRTIMNQSMMVEPPSHMDQSQTPEDTTAKLNVQAPITSPSQTQILNIDSMQTGANPRGVQNHQRRAQTPETQKRRSNRSEVPSPGHLAPFDWEDFEDRYEKALQEADEHERQILEEFEKLVKYFNVWASASSVHDNERAVKRLQTRERYVRLAEQSLSQKKQHLAEVVKAFQSALALLSAT